MDIESGDYTRQLVAPINQHKESLMMDRDSLYRDYMTIVFGLVATKGLEQLAESAFYHHLSWSQAPFFLGAFVVGIHYWWVCVNYATISAATYNELSDRPSARFGKNISRIIFFGVPVLFVSAYAGSVVMFFYAIPERYDLLFRAFWVLLLTSWINDVWDLAATLSARQVACKKDAYDEPLKLTAKWFGCDVLYFLIFSRFVNHRVVSLAASRPVAAGMVFLGLIALGVILDAYFTPAPKATQMPASSTPAPNPGAGPAPVPHA
jgi:hypothetical protein